MDLGTNDGGAGAGAGGAGAGTGDGGGAAAALLGGDPGAGGTGGAGGAGAGAGAGGGQDIQGGADPAWYGDVSADPLGEDKASHRDWLKAAGVKDINGLVKVARDNQQALRDGGRVKVPGEGASETEIREFHKAIGVPDDPKGYVIAPPAGADGQPMTLADGSPVPLDNALIERIAGVAHKLGVPAKAFEGLVHEVVRSDLEELAGRQAEEVEKATAIANGWGAQKNENLRAIDNAARTMGLSGDDLVALRGALGAEKALGMMLQIGQGIREDTMIQGDRQSFGIAGQDAQAEMDRLKQDRDFAAKAMVPGTAENERWKRLQAAAGAYADRKAAQAG